jgi:hypothetical protein
MQTVDWNDRKETKQNPSSEEVAQAVDRFLKDELKSVRLYRPKGRGKIVKPATASK